MDYGTCSLMGNVSETDARFLFEDCAWLYAFCREHLFRDHTDEIARALFPGGVIPDNMSVLEVGCGPGFYARRLAQRFPTLRTIGIDRSSSLIAEARRLASADALTNCRFQEGEVESLADCIEAVDGIISSRLLLVISDAISVVSEMFRVLKPGGRLFLAEPTSAFKTRLPLSAMRLVTHFIRTANRKAFPQAARVIAPQEFEEIIYSQPWDKVSIQKHGDYQCAICQKSGVSLLNSGESQGFQDGIHIADRRSFA
jgi:arsenite methyltransferase